MFEPFSIMPKFKQYKQKFRKEWQKARAIKDWSIPSESDENKAHCKCCRCDIRAKYQDLKNHAASKKNKTSVPFKPVVPLTSTFKVVKNNERHNIEGSIAMFLSCLCAISHCDHLVDMLKNNIRDCKNI